MMRPLPIAQPELRARAILLGERLELRGWDNLDVLATTPLALAVRGGGIAVLFRFGAAVFFGVAAQDEAAFLDAVRPRTVNPHANPETEVLEVRVGAGVRETITDGVVTLDSLTIERLQVIADVLAKSVVLALYETRVAATFDGIEPLANRLERTGRIQGKADQLLKHIGATLLVDHMMVGRVAVGEKPELLWDQPGLEGLYIRLEDEFELRERQEALERKLGVISRTAETLLELIQSRHALRVEWYIVALIVVELFLTLYQIFLAPHLR
jgi:uncharacterized Rmd1/YagE family protein